MQPRFTNTESQKEYKKVITKILLHLQQMTYNARLDTLKLPVLEERRERDDLITMFKAITEPEKWTKIFQ